MANILRFVILGDDRGGPAFASFTREVERANKAVDRNNAALQRQGKAARDARGGIADLKKELSGLHMPGFLATGALLAPSLIPVAGALAAGIGAVGVSLGAAAAGAAAFGLVAKPILTDASKAAQAVAKAQATYNAAIASGVPKAKAYKAEQLAIAKAYAGMSPAQIALSKQLGALNTQWGKFRQSVTPLVAGALTPWLSAVTRSLQYLKPVIAPVADLFRSWGESVSRYFASAAGSAEITRLATAFGRFSASQLKAVGVFITDIGRGIFNLGRALAGHNVDFGTFGTHLQAWGGAFLRWSQSAAARHDVTALLDWVRKNGPVVGDMLKNLGGFLAKFAPGLAASGVTELKLISGFLAFINKLPPGLAKPLLDTAGALLLLQKTGVVKVGLQVSLKGLGALGAAAGGGTALGGGLAAGGAAIAAGIVLKVREDLSKGFKGIIRDIPHWFNFGTLGFIGQAAQGWADLIVKKIRAPFITGMSSLGHFIAASFDQTRHQVAHTADLIGAYLAGSWSKMRGTAAVWWGNIARTVSGWWANIRAGTAQWLGNIARTITGWWSNIRAGAAQWWNAIWQAVVSRVISGVRTVGNWVGTLPGTIRSHFAGAGSWLAAAGRNVIQGLWNGLTAVWRSVTKWISGIAAWIKAHKGPVSLDQQLLYPAGHALMSGLLSGLKAGFGPVGSFVGGIASWVLGKIKAAGAKLILGGKIVLDTSQFTSSGVPNVGSGVARWRGTVLRALAMEHLPASLVNLVLAQMQSESGGNPNAINLTDINAQHGDPSRGLMQVIMATFRRWHWPGTSWNIYDPLANIAAALNYARHGRGFGTGPGQIGSMHGYAAGTPGAAPGWAWVGEKGPELVRMRGGETIIPAGASAALAPPGLPGYATGTDPARAYLHAWQTRHGGGQYAAWGPIVLNEQIARAQAAYHQAATLAGADGLTRAQHAHWAGLAAEEKKRLAALHRERWLERTWRGHLEASDTAITGWIAAAGHMPGLAGDVRAWKAQIARQKRTITAISAMLGYSAAYLAAHPAAEPATAAAKGPVLTPFNTWLRLRKFDQGGWLMPGATLAVNNTGRPEPVGAGGNTYHITVTVAPGTPMADAGRVIVGHIRAYEQGSGKGWRK